MTEYVAGELRRIIGMIPTVDPTTTEYHILLQSLECFAGIADSIEEIMSEIDYDPPAAEAVTKVTLHPALEKALEEKAGETPAEDVPKKLEAIPFKEFMERDIPKPEEDETEQAEPARVWEMTEVRAALVEARKKGVNVSALLREFGVENFGAFPAGKYDELMKRLEG